MKLTDYKNIIFDLGGVILDIDPQKTVDAFAHHVYKNTDNPGQLYQKIVDGPTLMDYEKGKLSDADFREALCNKLDIAISDKEFDNAFNALLLDYTKERLTLLEELKKDHRIFLLSNTCHIHYVHYNHLLIEKYGYNGLDSLFEKTFLSFDIGLRKPDQNIYQYVIKEAGINPEESVFIDDSLQNIEAAKREGIVGYHKPQETDLTEVF